MGSILTLPLTGELTPLQVKIARAARLLDCSERTVTRLLDTGELVAVGSGRLRRIEYASIIAYIERHRKQAA